MNKKTFLRFIAGIPILILILVIIIMINEPESEGISGGSAYKAVALLLTDKENCENLLKEQKTSYFSETDKKSWYAKYMNYLYAEKHLDPEVVPPVAASAESLLTYRQAKEIAEEILPGAGKSIHKSGKKLNRAIPAEEWWGIYDELRRGLDVEGKIQEVEVLLYGTPMNVIHASAWTAYTSKGNYSFEGLSLDSYIDRELKFLIKDGEIIALRGVLSDSVTYKNVWISSGEGDSFTVHLGTIERSFPLEDSLGQQSDVVNNIADISLKKGKLQKVTLKKKKISGKVLSIKDNAIEIEGYGSIKLDKDFKVYRLYGSFAERSIDDILVGYDNQEFVAANGKLCAALIVREFDAKSIRVLLMNTDFKSIFHPSVTLSAESGLNLSYGVEQVSVPPKAEVIIDTTDERLKDGRIVVTPVEAGDTLYVNSVKRSLGTPGYDGSIEIRKEPEGLILINELYLEEYLIKVVPSEMPDAYEKEALKAQAVCARTYAYRQIQSNTYSQYGAHVDDSTRFQVYNNLNAGAKTEEAVRETYGKLLFYEDQPIEAFYFSTSCGHTTDGGVWGSDPVSYPYLDAGLLQEDRVSLNLSTNSEFLEFIKDKDYPSYDSGFPMYRWETTVTNRQLEEDITSVGVILNISVTERGAGGIAKKLRIEGSDGVTTINGEGQVRAALGSKYMTITKNDGTTMKNIESLPSAYIAIENEGVDEKNITTFRIYGGGYGHGVGMSQNGAQAMAKEDKGYEDILKFFYQGAEVREAGHREE